MKDFPQGISMETRLVVNPNMVLREEDDECAILCDPDSGSIRILNLTAVAIWKLIDGQRTLSEVMEALRESFEDMDRNVEDQVMGLVRELCRVGALGTMAELSK
jgi:hypothetical protein